MAFDLASVLKDVPKLNTLEQIEYLPFALLDPDPENFYSLDGLGELADSIATVGLVHPLRVRPSGERYTVTSGHRRCAAIKLLIDSGEDWSAGVPCIVDHGEALPEFTELKMIFANNQRTKSAAELSREAEKTEALLAALKEKGYEFPGRMQEHVAAALNVKTGKLKRLHAIRSRAQEYVLDAFDRGEINESVAYELSKARLELQKMIMVQFRHSGRLLSELTADAVEKITDASNNMANRGCFFNKNVHCAYVNVRVEEALKRRFAGSKVGNCQKGGCCKNCPALLECESYCCKLETDRELMRAAQEQRRAEVQKTAEALKAKEAQARAENDGETEKFWRRVKKAAEASGADLEKVFAEICETQADVEQLLDFADGCEKDTQHFGLDILRDETDFLADRLDCSIDFLLGRTDVPQVNRGKQRAAAPDKETGAGGLRWLTGDPKDVGWYACKVGFFTSEMDQPRVFWWTGEGWLRDREKNLPIDRAFRVTRWSPLPKTEEML